MQTLVRVVVALVIVLLLLVVVVPLQLISMLVENDPESEPENESKSADDLEPGRPTPAARAAATSASVETPPRIRSEAINTR